MTKITDWFLYQLRRLGLIKPKPNLDTWRKAAGILAITKELQNIELGETGHRFAGHDGDKPGAW